MKLEPAWLKAYHMSRALLEVVQFVEFGRCYDDTEKSKTKRKSTSDFGQCTISLTLFPYLLKCIPEWTVILEPWLNSTRFVERLLKRFGHLSSALTRLSREVDVKVAGFDRQTENLQHLYQMSQTERTAQKIENLKINREILRKEFRSVFIIRTQQMSEIVGCLSAIAEHSSGLGWSYLAIGSSERSRCDLLQYLTNCSLLKNPRFSDPYFESDGEENPRHELWTRVVDLVSFLIAHTTDELDAVITEQ